MAIRRGQVSTVWFHWRQRSFQGIDGQMEAAVPWVCYLLQEGRGWKGPTQSASGRGGTTRQWDWLGVQLLEPVSLPSAPTSELGRTFVLQPGRWATLADEGLPCSRCSLGSHPKAWNPSALCAPHGITRTLLGMQSLGPMQTYCSRVWMLVRPSGYPCAQ